MKTAVVEEKYLGGICLNWGCIPTKALLRTAEISRTSSMPAISACRPRTSASMSRKWCERSRKVAKQLNGGVGHLLKKNKVAVFDGRGRLDRTGQGGGEQGRQAGRRPAGEAHHPRHRRAGRARCRAWSRTASWSGPTSKRWSPKHAEVAAGRRLRRHRHRIRQLLPLARRRGDRLRDPADAFCRSRTRKSPPSPASSSRSRA